MTTIETHAAGAAPASAGIASGASWFTTTDHKRIGRLYMGTAAVAFLGTVVVAALLAFERINIDRELLDVGSLTQLFSLYRFGFTYLVLAPGVVGLATAIVPLQVGARSIAFPRVAAAGFWAWFLGSVLAVYSIVMNGGPGGGEARFVDLFTLSTALVMAGLLATALSLVTTVLTSRSPGMNLRRVPFFTWSSLVMALALLASLTIAVGDLIVVFIAHKFPSVNPLSGNRSVENWVGFAFTQPLTLLFALPVLGLFADTAATGLRTRLRPRGAILTMIGLGGTAMFAAAFQQPVVLAGGIVRQQFGDFIQYLLPYVLVYGLPLFGIGVAFLLIGTSMARKPRLTPGIEFGMLGGLLLVLGAAATSITYIDDLHLVGTVYEEGTWLAVVFAGILCVMGGVAHWGPKWWGRAMPVKATAPLAVLTFVAGLLAAVPMMIAGFADQPGGLFPLVQVGDDAVVNYPGVSGPTELWNTLTTVGLVLALVAVLAFVGLALRSFTHSPASGDDPWDGVTLEWATTSPAPEDNFAEVHIVRSAEPLLDLKSTRSDA